MNPSNPLILVDGSQYLFRAYNAIPKKMYTSKGFPTHVVRGVAMMLRKLMINNRDATIVVVFDGPGKTFRDRIYSDYKANRPPMEEELRVQIQPTLDFIEAMGLPQLIIEDVEADDVIGTLATQATERGLPTVISSSDKDLAQLVSDHVSLENSMTGVKLDRDGVIDKFGVAPEQIIDYLALMGDSVDNIPGIPSVGPKTAAKWLNEFDTLDGVKANADKVKGKVGEKLRENMHLLDRSRELTTIKCDVEMPYDIDTLAHKPIDMERIRELCIQYELRLMLEQFEDVHGAAESLGEDESNQPKADIKFVSTVSDLEVVVNNLGSLSEYNLYILADFDSPVQNRIFGICLGADDQPISVLRFNPDEITANDSIQLTDALELLKPLFEDAKKTLVTYDVKTTRHLLLTNDIHLANPVNDVMLASYVLNSVTYGQHSLRGIAGALLDRSIPDDRDLLGRGQKRQTYSLIDDDALAKYVAHQVTTIQAANKLLMQKLKESETLWHIYNQVELPLEPYLCAMEQHGTLIDHGVLDDLKEELEARKESLTQQAYEHAGKEFKINSPKQLQVILFDELGLTPPATSKSGNRSTSEDVLSKIVHEHPLPQVVLDFRATTKLISTYVVALSNLTDPNTHRIHTTYLQANASTGRLASNNPNLQNIPIRTRDGRRVREAFIAPEGHLLLTADYSQIELRVMAHLTEDPGLTQAFQSGVDIHQATASQVFGTPLDQVDEDMRRNAKVINFGLMYGMSAFGLAKNLEIPQSEARIFMKAYFEQFPNVQNYVDETKETARDQGYVETILGRRIHLRDIAASDHMARQAAERLAINAPVQGSAADIIKKATISVGQWLDSTSLDVNMILQVHDELVFEVAEDHIEEAQEEIGSRMLAALPLNVPLEVDFGIASNWSAAH